MIAPDQRFAEALKIFQPRVAQDRLRDLVLQAYLAEHHQPAEG